MKVEPQKPKDALQATSAKKYVATGQVRHLATLIGGVLVALGLVDQGALTEALDFLDGFTAKLAVVIGSLTVILSHVLSGINKVRFQERKGLSDALATLYMEQQIGKKDPATDTTFGTPPDQSKD